MAIAGRLRSGFPLLRKALSDVDRSTSVTSIGRRTLFSSSISARNGLTSRNYASSSLAKEQKIKVPLQMFGVSGNYASALYLASVKANVMDVVESELLALLEASKHSPVYSQFMKDLSVTADTRSKAMDDICTASKFTDITKNFLVIMAENGRLAHLERIVQRFSELTMAHRGEVKVTVTTVIPLPPAEEKELKETLEEILGKGKKPKIVQKIDPSILGGLVVEFSQKVFDMSIRTRAQQMERFLRQPISVDGL